MRRAQEGLHKRIIVRTHYSDLTIDMVLPAPMENCAIGIAQVTKILFGDETFSNELNTIDKSIHLMGDTKHVCRWSYMTMITTSNPHAWRGSRVYTPRRSYPEQYAL